MWTDISLSDRLDPVEHRWRWFWWGIALQAIGVAIPVVVAVQRARHDGLGGSVTRATVRLIWHQMAQHPSDIGVIALGMVLFVAGCMVLARPLVSRRSHLVIAVPAAALLGFVVFGAVALLVAAAIALADSGFDLGWIGSNRSNGGDDDDDDERGRRVGKSDPAT